MENERGANLKKLLWLNVIVLAVSVSFLLLGSVLIDFSIPISYCLLHDQLHIYCPMCGGTRAALSLVNLDIVSALRQNAFFVFLVVAFICYDVKAAYKVFGDRKDPFKVPIWLIIALCVVCILFFIVRNLLMIFFGIDPLGELVVYWN